MMVDGLGGYEQPRGDGGIRQTLGQQPQHLGLATRERVLGWSFSNPVETVARRARAVAAAASSLPPWHRVVPRWRAPRVARARRHATPARWLAHSDSRAAATPGRRRASLPRTRARTARQAPPVAA